MEPDEQEFNINAASRTETANKYLYKDFKILPLK